MLTSLQLFATLYRLIVCHRDGVHAEECTSRCLFGNDFGVNTPLPWCVVTANQAKANDDQYSCESTFEVQFVN